MAHEHQLGFVEVATTHLAAGWADKSILEVGSYDVNGSTRSFFPGSRYIGVDLTEGPGVDRVCGGAELSYPDDSFDLSISCECFEHNPQWRETFYNMYRMTKSGGVVLFTCASTGRLEHGTTRTSPGVSPGTQSLGWDYYRNLKEIDFRNLPGFDKLFVDYLFVQNRFSNDIYFVGLKRGAEPLFHFDKNRLKNDYEHVLQQTEKRLLVETDQSGAKGYANRMARIPLRIAASIVPDRRFQNFALKYLVLLELAKKPIRKLLL